MGAQAALPAPCEALRERKRSLITRKFKVIEARTCSCFARTCGRQGCLRSDQNYGK